MKRRFLSILLTLCLVLSMLPPAVFATAAGDALGTLDSGAAVTLDSGMPSDEVLSLCRLYLLARHAAEQPDATQEQQVRLERLEENFERAFSPIRERWEELTELSSAEREDETVLAEYADTIQTFRAVDRMLSGDYDCTCAQRCTEGEHSADCLRCVIDGIEGCTGEQVCICTTKCHDLDSGAGINPDCPVCSKEGADLDAVCKGTPQLLTLRMGSVEAAWGVAGDDGVPPADWAGSGNLTDAVTYANGLRSGTAYIQLQSSSISIYNTLTIDTGKTMVLDLNGSSIIAENWPMTILTVDGTLTLKDTSGTDVANQGKLLGLSSEDAIGVYVRDGGNFTMEAGTISNRNPNNKGRGVKVVDGAFTMTGGSITGNTVTGVAGGGVWVENGTFNLSGGSISKNTAGAGGGGVVLWGSTFTMTGGSITNNSTNLAAAKANGGGVQNNWSTFVMMGGEISGNNAGTGGGGVMGDGFTVGGTAKITGNTSGDSAIVNNISLNANDSSKILTVSSETPLESGASFGISMNRLTPITTEKPANITGANTADVSAYFFSDNDAYAVQNGTDNIVQLVTAPSYQAAWGVAKADGSAPDSWVSTGDLTDAVEYAKNSGSSTTYIQLQSNVNTTSALGFGLDRTVILDLNGRTIKSTAGSGASVLDVYSAITITDSSSNDVTAQGKITGASNAFNGAVCVGFGGILTMNGGNITGNSGNSAGVFVFNGNFVMNGGRISDNHSANTGGGVSVSNNGNFTMNGGSITNNTAQYGGGVAATGNSFTMTGGSITNNTAQCGGGVATGNSFTMTGGSITNNTAENSGGVHAYNDITVGGTAVITGNTSGTAPDTVASNVCLVSDETLPSQFTLSISASKPLVKGASIGVRTEVVPTQANPVTFTGKNDSDYSGYFTSDNAAYVVQNSGSGNAQAVQLAIASEAKWGSSNSDGSVNWISSGTLADAMRYANSDYAYDSGYIQLQGNVKTTSTLNFDKQIILDLNGKTIDANKGNFSVLTLNNGSALIIRDSSTTDVTKQGKITGSATTANGGGMYVQPGGSVRMEGGNITGNAAENGGGVYVTGTIVSPSMPGNFAIAGGKISGNTASASGGGVYVNWYGHMQQYKNCSIENNSAENGGGVYVVGSADDKISSFTMQGGSITENSAKNGGGLYFVGNASNMINGRIADNTASESGGGVFVGGTSGSLTVKNTSTISGNTAKTGGGVYVNGDLKLESGSITNNTASENGGGAYIDYGYGFTMSGGSVADNTANKNGGGVYAGSSAFIMTGGSVTGNSSRQENGGGVYAPDSHFFVGGKAVVTDNTKGEAEATVANNVYLPKNIRIVYADVHYSAPPLTTGARIGVTTEIAPVKGTPVDITNVKQNTDNSGYFFSDNDTYMVKNSPGTIYCQVQLTAAPEARWGLAGTGGAAPTTWAGSGDLTEAMSYASGLSSFNTAYIQLLSDVSTNVGLRFNSYKSAILDLNGKTVNSQIENTDSVLVVFGNLTLTDSSSTDVTKQGKITGNSGADGGGGAYVFGGSFAMSGGNITGNTAMNGGGVYVGGNGSFTMTGGSISKNGTTSAGGIGGVYVDSGTLTIGGTAVITGNTKGADKVPSNMCLRIDKTVTVSPALTTGASIGVTAQQIPTSTKPVDITGKNNADYSKYFTSDSDMYLVQNSGSGSAQVVQLALNPANSGPVITTMILPKGVVSTAYSQTLAASGKTPITWSILSGTLPAGLSLNASTGVISGTPTMTGTSSFTVKAENSLGSDSKLLSITVTSSITAVTVTPATATVKKTKTQQFTANVTATDGTAKTVTWSVSGSNSSISGTGLLTVGGRETATALTVKATSTVDSSKFGTATVTVAAAPNVYTVTFDSDGGSAIAAVGNVEEGSTIKMPDPPTKESHRFDGWYTGKNGSGKQFTAATAVTASITVYAKWTKLVTVSGIVVEEEGEAPVSGATVTLSPTYGTTAVTTAADGRFSFANIPEEYLTVTAAFTDGSSMTVNVTDNHANIKIVKPKPYITITGQPKDAYLIKGIAGQSAMFRVESARVPHIPDVIACEWWWLKGNTPSGMAPDEKMSGSGNQMTFNASNGNIPDRGSYKLYALAYTVDDVLLDTYSRVATLKVAGTNTIEGVVKKADGALVSGATVKLEYADGAWPYGNVAITSSAVTQTTAADGAYKFELVPDGKYKLIITLPDGGEITYGPYDFPGPKPGPDPIDPVIVIPDKAEIRVSGQPQDATVKNGTAVTLTVNASATDSTALTYQWYKSAKNSTGSGEAIPGATANTYTPSTAEKGTAYYYCVVSGGSLASVTTRAAKVTVFTYGTIAGTVQTTSKQPIEGAKVELINIDTPAKTDFTTSTNPQTTLADGKYKFIEVPDGTYKLKITLPGTNGPVFVVEPINSPTVNSDIPATPPDKPTISITKQPASKIVSLNDTAEFAVNAGVSNDGVVLYQWYSNTTNSTTGGTPIYGATENAYRAPTSTKGVTYYYCVMQASGADSVTSNIAKLTVRNTSLTNLMTIEGDVVDENGDKAAGAEVTLSPRAGTSENPQTTKADGHYKFENLPDGQYTITIKLPGGGVITEEIIIDDGEITPTPPSNIEVPAANSITITQQPKSIEVTTDMTASFAAKATATKADVTYQWYKNTTASSSGGTKLDDKTNATLELGKQPEGVSYYYCVISSTGATDAVTNAVKLTVTKATGGKGDLEGGIVEDENGDPVADATVKLMKNGTDGIQFGSTVTTGEDGKFQFTAIPYGSYSLVAQKDTSTVTRQITIKTASNTENLIMPSGAKITKVIIEGDTPSAAVENLEAMFTGADNAIAQQPGATVEIRLVVEKQDDPSDKGNIDAALAENQEVGIYLDAKLVKVISGTVADDGTENIQPLSGQTLRMVIDLPESLWNKAPYQIIRSHTENGVTDVRVITPDYDRELQTLSFDADAFSTYAIVYTQAPKYSVTVIGSQAGSSSGTGLYEAGATVTVQAGSKSGYTFDGWTTADGVSFASVDSATTSFTMPAKNVTVTANWKSNGGGGHHSGGDDSGGDSDDPNNNVTPGGGNNNPGGSANNPGGGNSNNGPTGENAPENSSNSSNTADVSDLNEARDNALKQIAEERQKAIDALPKSLTDAQRQKALDEIDRIYMEAVKDIQNLDSAEAIADITNQTIRDFANVVTGAGGEMSTQAPSGKEKPFVLLSAALAAASALGASLAWRRREDEETDDGNYKRRRSRIIATAAAVAAILLFLLTTGWHGITLANWWTVAVAIPTAESLLYALWHK